MAKECNLFCFENICRDEANAKEYAEKLASEVGADAETLINYYGLDYIKDEKIRDNAIDLVVSNCVLVDKAEEKTEEKAAKPKKTTKKAPAKKAEKAEDAVEASEEKEDKE